MPIGGGQLRHIIELQPPTVTDTATNGEVTTTYRTVEFIRAEVLALKSHEIVRARQAQSETTHKILIRYHPQINSTWRIIWEGRILNIDGHPIDPDGFKRELHIMAIEVGNK